MIHLRYPHIQHFCACRATLSVYIPNILSRVFLKMETIANITMDVRKHIKSILQRRGTRRQIAIEELLDMVRQQFTRQGVKIEEYKLRALQLEGNLTEVKVNSIVETNYKDKCQKLEEEAEIDRKWKARYKKHHANQEEEIKELKKNLGIKEVPWYEQHEHDPIQT